MREIVLDTETTGLDPAQGHRIVEIGCIELWNHVAVPGGEWQRYLNPERDMPPDAYNVHGLSEAFLADKPRFAEIAQELLDHLGDARLVIHNASFDLRFLNAELAMLDLPAIDEARAIDTVQLARRKFPGAPANLDALCRRFGVDNSARTKHGALLDAELLAVVYLELLGGRQTRLTLVQEAAALAAAPDLAMRSPPRPHAATPQELAAHAAFLAECVTAPIWQRD